MHSLQGFSNVSTRYTSKKCRALTEACFSYQQRSKIYLHALREQQALPPVGSSRRPNICNHFLFETHRNSDAAHAELGAMRKDHIHSDYF